MRNRYQIPYKQFEQTLVYGIVALSIGTIIAFAPLRIALLVFVVFAAAGLLLLWLYRPLIAVRLYLIIVPLVPIAASIRFGNLPLITPQRVLFIALFTFWFIGVLAGKYRLKKTGIDISILIVVIVSLIPAFLTFDLSSSLFRYIAELIEYYGLAYLIVSILRERANVRRIVKDWSWVVLTVSLAVVIEVITSRNFFRELFPNGYWPSEWVIVKEGLRRGYGPFSHPIALGQFLVVMLPFVLCTMRHKHWWLNLVLVLSYVIALGMSLARTAWVGAIVVLLVLYARPKEIVRLCAVCFALLLVFIQPWFLQEYVQPIRNFVTGTISAFDITAPNSSTTVPVRGRLIVIVAGIQAFMRSPIIGYGLNASRDGLTSGLFGSLTQDLQGLENYYIGLLIDGGIILFVAKGILWLHILYHFYRGYRMASGDDRLIMRAFLASLFGYLTTLLVVNAWPQMEVIFWSIAALGIYYARSIEFERKTTHHELSFNDNHRKL
jgi:hypothetical protein